MPGMPSDKIVLVSGSLKDCTLGSKDAYCELANADSAPVLCISHEPLTI
jgi:hypothetical protein